MNVRQLRNLLLDYPDDLEILLAADPEGNGFHRLVELESRFIYANEDKHGAVEETYSQDDLDEPEEMEPRLVFWP
jgi:hypothetical protein